MNNNTLPAEVLESIELKAEHEAALHFHPEYSRDQNTACRICYRNGAKEYAEYALKLEQAQDLLKSILWMHETGVDDEIINEKIKTFLDGK